MLNIVDAGYYKDEKAKAKGEAIVSSMYS